ncbi:response regulator transcription factor [Aestuariimicrobium sp. T2.26MG-19.2B]|uniref:response regulator transcription factor n=1 Tax=Aestuariimicrobium sp. T2.26MG-19.2B TaxID=3040679 RepID=UPI002540B33B|nr:response regulator transcription factor [Aestuariimicrobium sp. T2.26MG-19.2B]
MSADESEPAATQVLVVDDEKPLAAMIAAYLSREGYQPLLAHTGPDAVAVVKDHSPEVMILDLGLPGLDGVEVCRTVRTFSDCYIIMVTARQDEVDKLIGLSVGADDYMTKPLSMRELVARVRAVLRRPRNRGRISPLMEEPVRVFGDLRVDPAGREVHVAGVLVDLTPTEFDILATLTSRPKLAFSRRQILHDVWGEDWVGDDHVVDVHVAHLRHKLGDDSTTPRYIRTVRGIGYRIGQG